MKPLASIVLALFAAALQASLGFALEARLVKESTGASVVGTGSCPLEPNLTGDCGNLRYFNVCSGYIWVFSGNTSAGEGVGVHFNAPCVVPGNSIERAITYFRNVVPGYNQTVDVYLDADADDDGCPERIIASDLDLDPGLRWNCSEFSNICVPNDVTAVIVRTQHDGGTGPTWATDGPFSEICDPLGSPHSFYYGINASQCVPWRLLSPTGRDDNLLYWLIVDSGCLTSTETTSWGAIKGLFR